MGNGHFRSLQRRNPLTDLETQSWEHKMQLSVQYDYVITNSRWRTDAILKIVLAISRLHIGRLIWNLYRRWIIICSVGHVTKTAIVWNNSRMRTAAILKIVLSCPYQPWIIQFRHNNPLRTIPPHDVRHRLTPTLERWTPVTICDVPTTPLLFNCVFVYVNDWFTYFFVCALFFWFLMIEPLLR